MTHSWSEDHHLYNSSSLGIWSLQKHCPPKHCWLYRLMSPLLKDSTIQNTIITYSLVKHNTWPRWLSWMRVRLESRRSRVRTWLRSTTFFHGDWSWMCTILVNFWLCWDLTTRQPLWIILCRHPEKGRKEIEEIVEEMKERDREERGTVIKEKKQKK